MAENEAINEKNEAESGEESYEKELDSKIVGIYAPDPSWENKPRAGAEKIDIPAVPKSPRSARRPK